MSAPQTRSAIQRERIADQIVEDLRSQILSGAMPDGSRLPSERDLATYYDVSGPTVREAVRVLTAMGLVNARNGSRSTVTAQGDTLLAMSIASVVQVERVGAREVLGLLGALNGYAAELAAEHADDGEIARLRKAASAVPQASGVERSAAALRDFFTVLSEISHNPLLASLCRFITEIQIGLAVRLSGGEAGGFGRIAGPLNTERMRIVAAVAARDSQHASAVVRDYHRQVLERIAEIREIDSRTPAKDSALTEALITWLRSNVTMGGQTTMTRSTPS
ncbi:FadR/GntR family transcriptional regulator [Streptomyces sp. NPDC086082]|uniref:FadR/GntR family transcriptional regulator n=1 Tax=Streptomyces sp. NPDC086082 TaxID=3365750 RepID=UPI0037FB000B